MKYWKRQLYRAFYKIFCLIPGGNLICFIECGTSHSYSNIDVLWEEMHRNMNIICINGANCNILNIWRVSRSRILLMDQSSPLISNLYINKKTECIQLWHSSGLYKYVGFDALRNNYNKKYEIERLNRIHGNIKWFIISDKKLVGKYAHAFNIQPERVLPLGLVRTDRLYSCNINQAKEKFFNMFPECKGKKLLLYAPTFRSSEKNKQRRHLYLLNVSILKNILGNDWCFLIRRHPTVSESVPEGWKDVSPLVQEDCLAISDVLVTDYSSILFDYSFFRRPIFLFIPDIEEYKENQRGLYVKPEDLAGENFVCRSSLELAEKVRGIHEVDQHIWERYMSACDGHSAKHVADFIKSLYQRTNQ